MTLLESTPVPECPGCIKLRRELDVALARIAVLEAQVQELLVQLQRNSSNSSTPPSANPLDAPKPVGKPPTGRKPGGQTGHRGHHRIRLPANRVNAILTYVPSVCTDCHTPLPIEPDPNDPEPSWHQIAEVPRLAAVVTEHQATLGSVRGAAGSITPRSRPRSVPTSSARVWRR